MPIVIVGAGAAGLATAIFARRLAPTRDVLLVDGAARPGAKILVSGGSRCNVTNTVVTEADYWGGKRTIIRRVLRRLPVAETVAFFEEIGVPLKEEPNGKLFPRSDRSRDVLDALLRAAVDAGVTISPATRILDVRPDGAGFTLDSGRGPLAASRVVLATGGLSLPKTGSDGAGLQFARALGHSLVPTTPALAPLLIDNGFHAALSGVAQDTELTIWVDGRAGERVRGSLLWTHFGISGPVALNASRHVLRAQLERRAVAVTASLMPGRTFEDVEIQWTNATRQRPRLSVQNALGEQVRASVAAALVAHAGIADTTSLADLSRDARRALVHALTALPLHVTSSRGYSYAEATAGGVTLDEIDPSTMESRKCPGMFLVGEMLDVDGRIGGFNFQWAWSSARTAAEALVR